MPSYLQAQSYNIQVFCPHIPNVIKAKLNNLGVSLKTWVSTNSIAIATNFNAMKPASTHSSRRHHLIMCQITFRNGWLQEAIQWNVVTSFYRVLLVASILGRKMFRSLIRVHHRLCTTAYAWWPLASAHPHRLSQINTNGWAGCLVYIWIYTQDTLADFCEVNNSMQNFQFW